MSLSPKFIPLRVSKKVIMLFVTGVVLLGVGITMLVIGLREENAQTLRSLTTAKTDIYYCGTNNSQQTLDLYRPKDHEDESVPLVVYIHGGGWRSGDKNNRVFRNYAPFFAYQSVAIATVNYRLRPQSPYPDQNNDVACALEYLTKNAAQLKINTKKMIFMGESAGGQLAAFAALNIPYKGYDYDAPIGVIDFYGVSNFSKIINGAHPDFNARRYLGSKYNQVADAASPASYVTKKAPRFLFIHGVDDTVVPISQSKALYDRLILAGVDAEYVALPSAPHGFVGPELPKREYKTVQDNMTLFLKNTISK